MFKRSLLFSAFWVISLIGYAIVIDGNPIEKFRSTSKAVKVASKRAVEITKQCEGLAIKLTTTSIGPFQWQKDRVDILGATSNTLSPTLAGKYTLLVEGDSSNEIDLKFLDPVAAFSHNASNNSCGNETITFTNTSTNGDKYHWDFGDGTTSDEMNPSHKFKANFGVSLQTFNVKLKVSNGECKTAEVTYPVTVKQLPDNNLGGTGTFTYEGKPFFRVCTTNSSATFRFHNESTTKAQNVYYRIDWGDGTPIYESNDFSEEVSHVFPVGLKEITYTVRSVNDCEVSTKYYVFVGSNPGGNVVPRGNTNICKGQSLTFDILGISNNPPGTEYRITFNDGSAPLVLVHPLAENFFTHTFTSSSCNAPGFEFTATFLATNPCGATPGTSGGIYVSDKPKSSFIKDNTNTICENTVVRFTSNSETRIATPQGCLEGKLVWYIEPLNGSPLSGYSTTSNLGRDRENPANPDEWVTGARVVDLLFTTPGRYKVSLRVAGLSNAGSCDPDLYSEEICVNPRPIADFTLAATSGCAPFNLQPTNTSNSPSPNCGNNIYQWTVSRIDVTECENVGAFSNLTSALENPLFKLTLPGKYKIALITKNTDGECISAEVSREVNVSAPPTAVINLSSSSICEGQSIDANATVKNCYNTAGAAYEWEFPGAGTTSSTLVNPTNIVYPAKGVYEIRLKVSNECGSSTVYKRNITVNETPILKTATLTNMIVCNGEIVPAKVFSTENGAIANYTWNNSDDNIGLGASGTTPSLPSFRARNNGTTPLTSTITVTPALGNCTGAPKTFTITVNPGAQVANAGLDQNLCNVTTTVLDGSLANQGGEWTIVSGTGLSFTDKNNPKTTIVGLQAGQNYELKWTVQGFTPCPTSSDNVKISVSPLTIGGTTKGANSFCGVGAGSIALSGHLGNVLRWERSPDGVANWIKITNTTSNLNYTGLGVGNYYYRAVVQSGNCTLAYSNITVIEVKSRPNPPAVTANLIYCLNDAASQLTANGTDLKWYKGLPLNSTNLLTEAPTPTTNIATTITYHVTQTIDGCESSAATIDVKVNPSITNNSIGAAQAICKNSVPDRINAIGLLAGGLGVGFYTYQWQSSTDGMNFTDIANATALTYQPGVLTDHTWYRRVVNSGTCTSISNEIKITVQGALDNIGISANQTICNGAIPAKLIGDTPSGGSGTFSYIWESSTISPATGFTAIPNAHDVDYQPFALTQTTYFRRLVRSGSCNGVSDVITIRVNPVVTLQQLSDIYLCNGTIQNAINFPTDHPSSNVTFSWANSEIAIGLAASGSGNLLSFTASNSLKRPLVAKIDYKATYTADAVACDAAVKSFQITVLPTVTVTSNLPNLTLCTGVATPAIPLNSDADVFAGSSVKYRWTSSVAIGLANGEGVQIPSFTSVNSGNSAIISVITVTPLYTYGGKTCEGTPTPYEITVNPAPKVEFSLPNQTTCSNTPTAEVLLTSTTANSTLSWTATPVAGITGLVTSGTDKISTQTLVNTTNAPITINYTASAATTGAVNCVGIISEYKITVNPIPVASAAVNVKTICSNQRVNVALNSNVAATMFSWTVSANPNVIGAENGRGAIIDQLLINTATTPQEVVYTVTPTFENGQANCNGNNIEVRVFVNPTPKVYFSVPDAEICSGATVPAVALSSNTPNAQITWQVVVPAGITGISSLSGASSINAETLVNTSNLPLTVIYKAVAKTDDATACIGEVSEYRVTVNPIARLTNPVLNQQICSGANTTAVILTSNVNAAVFSWVATSSSPNLTGFTASGTGEIPIQRLVNSGTTLEKVTFDIVTSAYGCVGLQSKYEITVSPSPIFTSSLATLAICSGKLFKYVPTSSTANVNFKWNRAFVAGISNAAGSGSGIDAAGSINETLVNTTVNPIEVTYEYEMSLNGCASGNKYPLVVTVNPQTTAKFGLSEINGCAPFNLVIKNLNSRALYSTYTVDFGDGSPLAVYTDTRDILHTYENDTRFVNLFYITITTRNDCGEAISVPFEIRIQPQTVFSKLVLNATQTFGCAPFTVAFTNTNQSTGANLFTWNFGDGSPIRQTRSVNENLSHTFTNAGDYNVTLTATNGCSTVITSEVITVYPPIGASFNIDKVQVCVTNEVAFTNTSDAQYTARWDFGDGTTSNAINPRHSYLTPGIKTVTLSATRSYPNGGTCTAVTTRTINVLAAPLATFTTNATPLNCGPFTLNVTANGSNVRNIAWDFGDAGGLGNTTTGLIASYTYTRAGDYLVTSNAFNADGCVSTSSQIIRVTESPIAAFSTLTQQICGTNANLNFKNETSYGNADAVTYRWLVNDSEVSTQKDLNHSFEVPAGVMLPYIFKVALEAINVVGCKTLIVKDIQFNPFPKAVFNVAQIRGCAPFRLSIINQSAYSNQYQWFLDGILVSTDKEPNNIILSDLDKIYNLKLVVKNQYGCTEDEQIMQVATYPYLKAGFTLENDLSCNGVLNLDVTNTSVGATSYTWDYGDGSPIYVGTNPTHSYGRPGIYRLKLIVSNGFCTDELEKEITISSPTKAAFVPDVKIGCNQLIVKFQNTSVNADIFYWDFGDGTFSREENPVHHYVFSKTPYTVKLVVSNSLGCSDQMESIKLISVFPPPEAEIVITPNKIIKVPEYSFNFKAVTTENIISYLWDFGDGQSSNKSDVTHKYQRFGTYKIKLHLTSSANCTSVVEDEVTILDFPGFLFIPNAFEPENLNNDLKVFRVKGGGMATYQMKIFNKWGQMIWQTSALDDQGAPLAHWDGMDKGKLLPQGAYFWQAEATFINGGVWKGMKYGNKSDSKTGVIHLIR